MQAGGSGGPRPSRASHTSQGPSGQSRPSGGPASNSQPPFDPTGFGLPDLTGYSPRQTPQLRPAGQPQQSQQPSQPAPSAPPPSANQPHSLDVTGKLARIRASESPSLPPTSHTPTLSQQIRAVAPPDVARQVLDQQKKLAHELRVLPDALETSGLAKTHERSYIDVVRAYVGLATETWIDAAEERLEQSGADETYRENAIAIARRTVRLRNESELAANNTQFPLPRRRPLFWRRRVRLEGLGLRDWQTHLVAPVEPREMGKSLARLRGSTAMAQASDLELLLWTLFPPIVGDVIMVLWLGFMITLIGAVALGATATVSTAALAATITLAVRIALSFLLRRGPGRLDHLFALSVFSSRRSPRAGASGSAFIGRLIRAWGLLISLAGLLGMVAALGYSVWQIAQQDIAQPGTALDWLALVGRLIANVMWLPALVGVVGVGALALPVLLISALRYIGELGGNIGWVPAARRYALAPALHVLLFVAAGAVAALAVFAPQLGLRDSVFTSVTLGPITEKITLQTVALFVVPALILLAGLDIPFRVGIYRWQQHWLRELATRRADIDAHVRRLSALDPRTGEQDTSEENLRAMQYDMVLLQFYKTRTEETRNVTSAPYGLLVAIGFVLALAAVALLVDGVAQQVVRLLFNVG